MMANEGTDVHLNTFDHMRNPDPLTVSLLAATSPKKMQEIMFNIPDLQLMINSQNKQDPTTLPLSPWEGGMIIGSSINPEIYHKKT